MSLIQEIMKIICEPNDANNGEISIYSFTNDNPPNNSIVLFGTDKIQRYKSAVKQLYEKMKIESLRMSLDCFTKILQQLIFSATLTEENIKSEIEKRSSQKYTTIGKIYGINLKNQTSKYGKFQFVSKDYLFDFLNSEVPNAPEDLFDDIRFPTLSHVGNEAINNIDFVYLLITCDALDSVYAKEQFDSESLSVVNALRYMAGIKHERIYIDTIENKAFMETYLQFAENGYVGEGSKINVKDIAITLDDDYFYSEENGNKQIWLILSSPNRNALQKKIVRSIEWAGRSIHEVQNDIACTEVAFAFESLLKSNESDTPISASIQGQIAETVAFICGNDKESRKNIIRIFKELYSYRSSIAHGGSSSKKADYNLYFHMFKETLIQILCFSPYNKCETLKQLLECVDDIKFQ